jgi:hypothetical protein
LTIHLHGRRLTAVLAVALSMAAVVVLALFPQTMAQARKPACPSSSTGHPKPVPHSCARSGRTPNSPHKGKAHARPKVKGHHSRHAAVKKIQPTTTKNMTPPASTRQTEATCEDGSDPVLAGDGSLSCEDGSEEACEIGVSSISPSEGPTFVCGGDSSAGSGSAGVACEDGSAAVQASDGSFSCAEDSEPT